MRAEKTQRIQKRERERESHTHLHWECVLLALAQEWGQCWWSLSPAETDLAGTVASQRRWLHFPSLSISFSLSHTHTPTLPSAYLPFQAIAHHLRSFNDLPFQAMACVSLSLSPWDTSLDSHKQVTEGKTCNRSVIVAWSQENGSECLSCRFWFLSFLSPPYCFLSLFSNSVVDDDHSVCEWVNGSAHVGKEGTRTHSVTLSLSLCVCREKGREGEPIRRGIMCCEEEGVQRILNTAQREDDQQLSRKQRR